MISENRIDVIRWHIHWTKNKRTKAKKQKRDIFLLA